MQQTVISNHPAQLWIGNITHLSAQADLFFKKLWCPKNGCNQCISCTQITTRQHPSLLWIDPPHGYTVDSLVALAQHISLQRSANDPFFFVLCRADFLTTSVGNALLKSLEEPPTGYHFLLLAERKQLVLPTVASRCIISYKNGPLHTSVHKELHDCFIQKTDPLTFLKILEKSKITERESMDLVDQLFEQCIALYKKALVEGKETARITKNISLLEKATLFPPMAGSSKLFWKNLFLTIYVSY